MLSLTLKVRRVKLWVSKSALIDDRSVEAVSSFYLSRSLFSYTYPNAPVRRPCIMPAELSDPKIGEGVCYSLS